MLGYIPSLLSPLAISSPLHPLHSLFFLPSIFRPLLLPSHPSSSFSLTSHYSPYFIPSPSPSPVPPPSHSPSLSRSSLFMFTAYLLSLSNSPLFIPFPYLSITLPISVPSPPETPFLSSSLPLSLHLPLQAYPLPFFLFFFAILSLLPVPFSLLHTHRFLYPLFILPFPAPPTSSSITPSSHLSHMFFPPFSVPPPSPSIPFPPPLPFHLQFPWPPLHTPSPYTPLFNPSPLYPPSQLYLSLPIPFLSLSSILLLFLISSLPFYLSPYPSLFFLSLFSFLTISFLSSSFSLPQSSSPTSHLILVPAPPHPFFYPAHHPSPLVPL